MPRQRRNRRSREPSSQRTAGRVRIGAKRLLGPRRTDEIATMAREARRRIEATGTALEELAQKLARLAAQPVTPGAIDTLANRITALERTTATVAAEIGKRSAAEAADRAARI